MDIQLNQLGQSVADSGEDSRYDAEARNLLSNKPFLAWILKYTTTEFSGMEPDDIILYIDNDPRVSSVSALPGETNRLIEGLRQESNIPTESTVFYDIRFFAKIPGKGGEEEYSLIIDVEMQNDEHPGYDLISRGILYCGRMLSEQMGRNVSRVEGTNRYQYRHLQKVYSIWIIANCGQKAANTISKYSIAHEALYGEYEDHARSDLVNVVAIRLPKENEKDKAVNKPMELHSMLSTIFSRTMSVKERLDRLENEFGITVTEKIRKEVTDMCNLSQGIRNDEREDTVRRMIEAGETDDNKIAVYSNVNITRVKEIRKEEKTKTEELVTV